MEGTRAQRAAHPKMLALPTPHVSHVECRIRFERGNLPYLSQRDPTRNLFPQEVLHNPPLRNRCLEAPSARARAPASPRWPGRAGVSTSCSERRLRFAWHSFQRQEHGGPAETPRTVCGPMRPSHRRVGAVGLQLGRGQGTSACPAPAGHLCAQKPGSPAGKRDPRSAQGRIGAPSSERQVLEGRRLMFAA